MDETQRLLELLNSGFPDIASMDPLAARAAVDARVRPPQNISDVASTEDHVIAASGGEVPVRVYMPFEPRTGAPTTVYVHGGGFVHGSIASHDGFCRRWARNTGAPVVSVDHRLAPEYNAPAPMFDVAAAIDWTVAGSLGNGVIVAGDSSGGNLAAAAAIEMRDRGDSPVVGQVLIYPFLDPAMASNSYRARAQGYFVTARSLRFYWETYLGGPAENATVDWRISPPRAESLAGLAPAIIVTAGLDPLSDEGRDYAQALRESGVTVIHRHYPDQFHGFLTIADHGPGKAASQLLWADIAHTFSKESPR